MDAQIADEWCKAEWWRKSLAFCALDVNACFADYAACAKLMPSQYFGGSAAIEAHFRRRDPARSSAPALSPVERFDSRLRLIARASRREIHHVGRSRSVTDRLRASARVSEEAVLGVIFLWRER